MPANASNGTKSSRFELPALNLNFGSITDGTNIPPPPDSPVEKPIEKPAEKPAEKPSQTAEKKEEATKDTAPVAATKSEATNGNSAGVKRPAEDVPPSPTASTNRPGSLRRLLSRTLLNNSYAEGQNGAAAAPAASVNGSRPQSRSGGSFMDDRKSKRSSGWFRRLRGGESKRSSLMFEQTPSPTTSKPTGPPPPMIPELKELEKDEGSLGGGDLFKNIK